MIALIVSIVHAQSIADKKIPKTGIKIRENVLFHERETISMSRSQWIFSFYIDLEPFQSIIEKTHINIRNVRNVLYKVLKNYDAYTANTNKDAHITYVDLFQRQTREITHIESNLKTITKLYNNLHEFQSNIIDNSKRRKRSIAPFLGNILNFLFGVTTDRNLNKVKTAFKKLAKEQNNIKHIINENLSIINISRSEIKENRHTINGLIYSLESSNQLFQNITSSLRRKIFDMNYFISIYLQADILIQEMHQNNQRAISYLNTINQQLTAFGTGHISQSVIPPQQLKSLLLNISRQLPDTMSLPQDVETNLWFYYRYLRCSLITKDNKFLIISSIHINDVSAKFTIFNIINVPVGYFNLSTVAFYKIDMKYLAISLDNTKYMSLSPSEALLCTHGHSSLCAPNTPIYPVINTKSCAISLFMHRSIDQNCKKIFSTDITLPSAIYITDGIWVITSVTPITMTMVCGLNKKERYIIKPFFQIIKLKHNCHAFSDVITLPAYFQGHSDTHIENEYSSLVTIFNQSLTPHIWKTIDKDDDYNVNLPPHLKKMKDIHLRHFVENMDTHTFIKPNSWKWQHYTLIILSSIVSSIIIYKIFKRIPVFRKLLAIILRLCADRHIQKDTSLDQVSTKGQVKTKSLYPVLTEMTDFSARAEHGLPPATDVDSESLRTGQKSIHEALQAR